MSNAAPAVTRIRTEVAAATTQSTNHYTITASHGETPTSGLYLCSFLRNIHSRHPQKQALCFLSLFRNAISVNCLILSSIFQHLAPGKQTKRNKNCFTLCNFSNMMAPLWVANTCGITTLTSTSNPCTFLAQFYKAWSSDFQLWNREGGCFEVNLTDSHFWPNWSESSGACCVIWPHIRCQKSVQGNEYGSILPIHL